MSEPFLKLMKSPDTMELATKAPNAFILLMQIAWRAKRTNGFSAQGLGIGQALIGDYKSIGLTERKYRTAKALLKKGRFATFKATNKGTIATLINSRVFDINEEGKRRAKRRSKDEQETTNKKVKNVKKILSSSSNPTKSGKPDPIPKDLKIPFSEIIAYLNSRADRNFGVAGAATRRHISARWKEGYRLDDFKAVVDRKVDQWAGDPKMSNYLRPETLFGTKFEAYRNEKGPAKKPADNVAAHWLPFDQQRKDT